MKRIGLLLLILNSYLASQRAWIVDVAMGGGADYPTIQEAVDAASSGDAIIIRSGVYAGFTCEKGLRVKPDANNNTLINGVTTIRNLPVGDTMYLGTCIAGNPTSQFIAHDCCGRVLVQGLDVQKITIRNCREVHITDVSADRMECESSNVLANYGNFSNYSFPGQSTVKVTSGSTLVISNLYVLGYGSKLKPISCEIIDPPGVAVEGSDSAIALLGWLAWADGGAATGQYCSLIRTHALDLQRCTMLLDETMTFRSTLNLNASTLIRVTTPTLAIRWHPFYKRYEIIQFGAPQGTTVLYVGLPSLPLATSLGPVYFDPATAILLDTGPLVDDPLLSWSRQVQIPFPRLPLPTPIVFQSAVVSPRGIEIGAPATFMAGY